MLIDDELTKIVVCFYKLSYDVSILEITSLICSSLPLLLSACVYIDIVMQSTRIFCPIHTLCFAKLSNKYLDMPRGFVNVCNVLVFYNVRLLGKL